MKEAEKAAAAYLPHRSRPVDLNGLKKNLRLGSDGRYYWHWDPRFLCHSKYLREEMNGNTGRFTDAARCLQIPTLLVRGHVSDVLSKDAAMEFLELVPHAEYADVQGAGHMIAGDKNDLFSESIINFLESVKKAGGR